MPAPTRTATSWRTPPTRSPRTSRRPPGRIATEVEEAVDEAATDAAELVARNVAAEQGEQQFEDAGFPLDDSGLACEATVGDELDAVDVTLHGDDRGRRGGGDDRHRPNELPGASVTELEGQFTGTVDGTEAFTTDTLGG